MTQALSLQTIVAPRTELLASELSDTEMVMMNIDKGFYYGLEEVAKTIWDALDQPRTAGELCDVVLASYADAERAAVESDLFVFLRELLAEDLIHVQIPETGHECFAG